MRESYGKHLFRVWSPLIVKMMISYAAYWIFSTVYTFIRLRQGGENMALDVIQNGAEASPLYDEVIAVMTQYSSVIECIAALITIPVLYFLMFKKDRVRRDLENRDYIRNESFVNYLLVAVMAVTASIGLNNLIELGNLSNYSDSYETVIEGLYAMPVVVQILCLAIVIPLCEELTFRGIILNRLRERSKYLSAAVYSSLIFGITHGNLVQFLYAFILGMLFCFVYEKIGSLKAAYIAHMAANLTSIILTQAEKLTTWVFSSILPVAFVTCACVFVATSCYVKLKRLESGEIIKVIE